MNRQETIMNVLAACRMVPFYRCATVTSTTTGEYWATIFIEDHQDAGAMNIILSPNEAQLPPSDLVPRILWQEVVA